jgi:hypothetical protein
VKVAIYYTAEELPSWVDQDDLPYDKDWCGFLTIEDGDYKAIYNDHMEPEDATFDRGLNWIKKELERAAKR